MKRKFVAVTSAALELTRVPTIFVVAIPFFIWGFIALLCSYPSLLVFKIAKQSLCKFRGISEGAQDAVYRREITHGICRMLTLRATRHLFRLDDGNIDACGDLRLAKSVAI